MKTSNYLVYFLLIAMMGFGVYNKTNLKSPSFKLVWEDNFKQPELDTTIWSLVIGDGCPQLCGWGNNELQYYLDKKENVRIEDGKLIIQAHKKPMGNRGFTSGKLVTKNKADWKYGKIEVRAILPYGMGTWPAIWMLPTINSRQRTWPEDGEIDIMEHVGYNHGMIYGTVHTTKYNGSNGTHQPDSIFLEDAHENFHTYSIEWTEDDITWFADGIEYHKLNKGEEDIEGWPFNQFNYHLILNLAVGGNWGGQFGIDQDIWPQTLTVDYVRYYALEKDE